MMERPPSKRLGEAAWWFDAAERDLAMARALRREGLYEGTAFHCQQAAEKFLKGLLAAKRRQWHRTHSCVELLELMPDLGFQPPESVLAAARRLDLHYVDSRYPNGVGAPPSKLYDHSLADEALAAAEAVRRYVCEQR